MENANLFSISKRREQILQVISIKLDEQCQMNLDKKHHRLLQILYMPFFIEFTK